MFKKLFDFFRSEEPMIEALAVNDPTLIPYFINDPTTPQYTSNVRAPSKPLLDIIVAGYTPGVSISPNTLQAQAGGVYITIANTLNHTNAVISQYKKAPTKWPGANKLLVQPRAGKTLNAYYDRKYIKFFYETDPVTKKVIYLADSADVVAHETGHGILDVLRPDLWSSQALEIWAFHEAFADIVAMFNIMHNDMVLTGALKETNNDLRKSSIISKMAEEMGLTLYHMRYTSKPLPLRDAVNTFKYTAPKKLPENAPDEQLSSECHSFGRLFVGTWYDIMVGIYDIERTHMEPIDALKLARDTAFHYLVVGVIQAPRVNNFYESVAKCMLAADKLKKSKYATVLNRVFSNRKIVAAGIKMLTTASWDDVMLGVKKTDIVIKKKEMRAIKIINDKTIKLGDFLPASDVGMLSVQGVDLSGVELDVPSDSYYEFDGDGNLVDCILPDHESMLEDVQKCIQMIQYDISSESHTAWEIQNNKLKRSFIECQFCGSGKVS